MTKTDRERVLYVTPIMPRPFGNGLAMRVASVLAALARRFEVHLFVVPVAGDLGSPSEFVSRHTERVGVLDLAKNLDPLFALIARVLDPEERAKAERNYPKPLLSRFATSDSANFLFQWSKQFPVAGVYVMRLYLASLALPFLRLPASERPFCVLDLDDDDVRTYERLAGLQTELCDSQAAAAAAAEAKKYQTFADRHVQAFDCVTVCSGGDARRLRDRFPGVRFAVVPNSYAVPERAHLRQPSTAGPLRLVFVGCFGYFPNVDAAMFLCREVLPALRRLADREIHIDLIGSGDTSALRSLAEDPSVTLRGFVEDLALVYAAADVAVVPMRAGGGTRIKILEAFAHGVPVVTTSLGAEGIDVADGKHLLFADSADEFARACLRLKAEPELSAFISARATALLATRYSPAHVDAGVAETWGRAT